MHLPSPSTTNAPAIQRTMTNPPATPAYHSLLPRSLICAFMVFIAALALNGCQLGAPTPTTDLAEEPHPPSVVLSLLTSNPSQGKVISVSYQGPQFIEAQLRVSVGGTSLPGLFVADPDQIHVMLPPTIAAGPTTLEFSFNDPSSILSLPITILEAPAIGDPRSYLSDVVSDLADWFRDRGQQETYRALLEVHARVTNMTDAELRLIAIVIMQNLDSTSLETLLPPQFLSSRIATTSHTSAAQHQPQCADSQGLWREVRTRLSYALTAALLDALSGGTLSPITTPIMFYQIVRIGQAAIDRFEDLIACISSSLYEPDEQFRVDQLMLKSYQRASNTTPNEREELWSMRTELFDWISQLVRILNRLREALDYIPITANLGASVDQFTSELLSYDNCENGLVVPESNNNRDLVESCWILLYVSDALRGTASLDWSDDIRISAWTGIGLDDSRVVSLNLDGYGLTGRIPPQLGMLPHLRNLRLFDNALTGTIPTQLGLLSELEYLHLSFNRLTGDIPGSLGNLLNLKELSLSENFRLSGAIPVSLSRLSEVVYLNLGGNRLTGMIPEELGRLDNLLRHRGQPLEGTPSLVGGLYLHDNLLSGCIPKALEVFKDGLVQQTGELPVCAETTSSGGPSCVPNCAGEDLRGRNLVGANLECVDFTGADLSGADLNGADLEGTNLTNAKFIDAELAGADLSYAAGSCRSITNLTNTDFSNADLSDATLWGLNLTTANLNNATLEGTNLECTNLRNADLRGAATLAEADLRGADLRAADLRNPILDNVNLSGSYTLEFLHSGDWTPSASCMSTQRLQDADLRGANLRSADLRYANLEGANMRNAVLSGVDLRTARFTYQFGPFRITAELSGADLSGADLSGASMPYGSLEGANLNTANLSNTDLSHANLQDADLRDADLSNASMRYASIDGANLAGANLTNTDFFGVTGCDLTRRVSC